MSSDQGFKETEFGIIPQDWELDILKNRTDIIMGQSPPSKFYNNKGIGIPFMQGRKTFGDKYHTIDTWCTRPKRIAKQNSILMSVRAPVGDLNIANTELCIGRGLSSINMKNGNNEFLYYLLKNYKNQIISKETGTVFGSVNKLGIEKLKLPFPSEKEQERIASIISSLDEKIELNNQINKNLEEIAQVIFKHWFIDFKFPDENGEPYKSSGGEMVDSELGPIPKGWGIANFNAFVNEISNGDWGKASASDKYEKKVYCMRGTDIPEICEGRKGKMPIRYILEKNLNKIVLSAGDLVIEISGGSPTQSTGRTTYVSQEILNRYDVKLICSNFCKVIKLKNKNNCEYLFLCLKYLYELKIFFNFENGTTGIKNLDIKNLFEKYKIKVPDNSTVIKFSKIIREVFRKIQENGYENDKLSSLRDTLLPKLMSGEVRVPINNKNYNQLK